MMNSTSALLAYAPFKKRTTFYWQRNCRLGVSGPYPGLYRTMWWRPNLPKNLRGFYADKFVDLRTKENLNVVEDLRAPKERDFYQDHTYHNQWKQRDLDQKQTKQLVSRYRWMAPGFQKDPWMWFPGDLVEVVKGNHAGQRGVVLSVLAYKNEITVQNVNVQEITIPATDTRPEQVMQREHPISVDLVQHIDPKTGEPCELRIVTVRNRENGELEKRRISLSSGTMLMIPKTDEKMEGDPLKDTPMADAEEETFDHDSEIQLLVDRKLRAMEDWFVKQLKHSYYMHKEYSAKNEVAVRTFQADVLERAKRIIHMNAFRRAKVKEQRRRSTASTAATTPAASPDSAGSVEATA